MQILMWISQFFFLYHWVALQLFLNIERTWEMEGWKYLLAFQVFLMLINFIECHLWLYLLLICSAFFKKYSGRYISIHIKWIISNLSISNVLAVKSFQDIELTWEMEGWIYNWTCQIFLMLIVFTEMSLLLFCLEFLKTILFLVYFYSY